MDLTGKRLGKYELKERLGRGGMAEVYKAFQTGVERFVAVKVMHSHLSDSADFRQRFQREAKAVGNLQHPHIMRVIDFDSEGDQNYMVMEFVQGGTLRDYLNEKGALPVPEALALTKQLANALRYAHNRGMIHRDIKPANVMFSDPTRTHTVLADFGVAKMLSEAQMTVSGTMLGTPAYMPPEVVKGEPADHRADIFSLGAMLYEMVTGRTPHTGDTPYAVMLKQANEPSPPPTEINPDLPPEVEAFVMQALAQDPDERFDSAESLIIALQQLDNTAVPHTPPIVPTKRPQKQRKWVSLVGAIIGIAIIAALTVWALTSFGGDEDNQTVGSATATEAVAVIASTATPESTTASTDTPLPPEPTTAPTTTPTTAPTAVLTVAPTVVAFDPVSQPAFICAINFDDSAQETASVLRLELDRVQLPDEGMSYVAWFVGADVLQVGELTVENGRVLLEQEVGTNIVRDFDRFLITAEPTDAIPDTPSDRVVIEQGLSAEFLTPMRQLLLDDLANADAQLDVAMEHAKFLQEALTNGNFPVALAHAEHVLNVLDGSDGDNHGDVNRDDRVEDPGDGIGVRGHLVNASNSSSDALSATTMTAFNQTNAFNTGVALEHAQTLLAEAQELTLKLFAMDSFEEARPFADELEALLVDIRQGQDSDENGVIDRLSGEGGIALAYESGLNWLAESYFAESDGVAGDPDFSGALYFTTVETSEVSIQLNNLLTPAEGSHYHLWLTSESGEMLDLGALTVEDNRIRAMIDGEQPLLASFDSLLITIESDDAELSVPSDTVAFRGGLDAASRDTVRAWLFEEGGIVPLAIEQTLLAIQHSNLMQEALDADDLTEARRHAEHAVNILNGENGAVFGDLDGDGLTQNPGDGVGVSGYLVGAILLTNSAEVDTNEKIHYATLIDAALTNSVTLVEEVTQLAIGVLSADTVEEAEAISAEQITLVQSLLDGIDLDENGVIDPFALEGGIQAIHELIVAYAHFPISAEP